MKCINFMINHLQTKIANTKTCVQQKLDDPLFTKLQNSTFSNKEKIYLKFRNTQIKKLDLLTSKAFKTTSRKVPQTAFKTTNTSTKAFTTSTTSSIKDRCVINISKKGLASEEKSLLQKAPNLVSPVTIPVKEYISTATVRALQADECNHGDCSGLYHDVSRILNTYTNKSIPKNISKRECLAHVNLRKDKNCITVTADKDVALFCNGITQNTLQNIKSCNNTHQSSKISPKTHPNYPQRTC